jgi:hypothetical protein
MKYVAKVARVLQPGIHRIGAPGGPVTLMQPATRVEIELDGAKNDPCMMYRYAEDDAFAGDTWHQSLANAFEQATLEYGLQASDFSPVNDDK